MKICIRTLITGEETEIQRSYEIPMEEESDGCKFTGKAEVSVKVKSMGGYIVMTADCKADYDTVCARCLEKITGTVKISIERPVAIGLQKEDEEDEYIELLDGNNIDPDELIKDELVLSLPLRSLCKEDCKGLCPKCGCNRNKKECDCVLKEPDPRWAALKKFSEK